MKFSQYLKEASYVGNVGFTEMVEFYKIASKDQIKKIEEAIRKNDWNSFKSMIKKVLGIELR